MPSLIHLLPDTVANQIAAGEVIQRPSSVIKELMENSVDAGASLVQVFVTDAGKTCIQVIDNGKGMNETDARLSFERHATSKISTAADLFNLHTMGFRGEALASIAAVAQVELRTRTAESELGVSIVIEGNKLKEQTVVSTPVGANFSVRNLFFNVPVRRKFLKSNSTELSNILTEFERIALAHTDVAFKLFSNDALLLDLPSGNFRQRIAAIFGRRLDSRLLPVQVETSLVAITGFVGTPESARKKGAQQYFFVNDRYMRHPYFGKSVMTAYERLIPEGEQVPYFLSFRIDPSHIDVNIHPTKTEIKFQDEPAIWQILQAAVREALGKFHAVPTIDFDTENRPEMPAFRADRADVAVPEIEVNADFNPFETSSSRGPSWSPSPASRGGATRWQDVYASALEYDVETRAPRPVETPEPKLYASLVEPERRSWERSGADCFQYRGRYIVTSVQSGLLFVDQHRAHVRILYDRYKRQLEEKGIASQGMLFPAVVQLSPAVLPVFQQMREELLKAGFEFEENVAELTLRGVPAGTEGLDPERLLLSVLDEAVESEAVSADQVHHRLALSLARKSAIPVGQALSLEEMTELIENLFSGETPNFTPDGLTTLVLVSDDRLERMFG